MYLVHNACKQQILIIDLSTLSIDLPPFFNGTLHPKQDSVFFANFMRPPVVGAAMMTVRVCSPDNKLCALVSPRIGSKILNNGLQ